MDYFTFGYDEEIVITDEFGNVTGTEKYDPDITNYRLTLSSEVIKDLFVGVNFNLLHPEIYTPGITKLQHPVLVNGLMDITSSEEASAWESPGVSQQRSWNPIERKDYFIHYLNIIKSNVVSFYYFIIKRNIGALFVISVIFY